MAWPQKWTKQQPEHSKARHGTTISSRKWLGSPDTSHAQVDPNEAGFCHGPARRGWQGFARLGMGLISTHWDPARVRVQRPPRSNTGPKWAGCWYIKISMRTYNSTSLPLYRRNQPCFWDFLTSLSVPPNTIQRITSTRRDMRAPFAWVSDVFGRSFFKFLFPLLYLFEWTSARWPREKPPCVLALRVGKKVWEEVTDGDNLFGTRHGDCWPFHMAVDTQHLLEGQQPQIPLHQSA